MASFNKVMLIGNLTRDPQVKHLPSNTVVAEFGLACNRKYRTQAGEEREEVAFVDCTVFSKQAEVIAEHCTKGKPLFVEGRLKYDTWEDKLGGGKRSKLSVVVENFQFIGPKGDSQYAHGDGEQSDGAAPPSRGASGGGARPMPKDTYADSVENALGVDDPADIPFRSQQWRGQSV